MRRADLGCVLPALVLAATTTGCVQREIRVTLEPSVRIPERPVLFIFVDGVQKQRFDELLRGGKLPNIDKYLVKGGVSVRRATTVLPSITYAVTATMLTGRTPGGHGIVDNAYFDRHQFTYRDYVSIHNYRHVVDDFRAPTLHEILADKVTANILLPNSRGADRSFDNVMSVGASWFFNAFDTVDYLTTLRVGQLAEEANRCGRWPHLIVAYFVSCDEVAHKWGADSKRYARAMVNMDAQIGLVMRFLERNALLSRYRIVWATDHGHTVCPNRIDAGDLFRERLGIPCVNSEYDEDDSRNAGRLLYFLRFRYLLTPYDSDTKRFAQRVRFFRNVECVVVPGGKRKISVHIRANDDWAKRPTYAQIQAFGPPPPHPAPGEHTGGMAPATAPTGRLSDRLLAQESVGAVMVRDGDDAVHVFGRAGHGRVDRRRTADGKRHTYRVVEGADPLGYAAHPPAARLMDGSGHPGIDWQKATYETAYPDVVGQVVEMFDSYRTGDLVVFAAPGWHFDPDYRGSHGGIDRSDMHVPMFFAGPDLPRGATLDVARTLDVAPTILGLMGLADRIGRDAPMDGINLVPQLRRSAPLRVDP